MHPLRSCDSLHIAYFKNEIANLIKESKIGRYVYAKFFFLLFRRQFYVSTEENIKLRLLSV